jgi:hypothetical protein
MQRGGNAADASVSVALCLGVLQQFASGIGGGSIAMYVVCVVVVVVVVVNVVVVVVVVRAECIFRMAQRFTLTFEKLHQPMPHGICSSRLQIDMPTQSVRTTHLKHVVGMAYELTLVDAFAQVDCRLQFLAKWQVLSTCTNTMARARSLGPSWCNLQSTSLPTRLLASSWRNALWYGDRCGRFASCTRILTEAYRRWPRHVTHALPLATTCYHLLPLATTCCHHHRRTKSSL